MGSEVIYQEGRATEKNENGMKSKEKEEQGRGNQGKLHFGRWETGSSTKKEEEGKARTFPFRLLPFLSRCFLLPFLSF